MKQVSVIRNGGLSRPLAAQILTAIAASRAPMTAGAISFVIGRGARGALGSDPAPEVAAALTAMVGAERVIMRASCRVCGLPGEVYALRGRAVAGDEPGRGPAGDRDRLPAPGDASVEIGERPELVEQDCCRRVARPWRRAPHVV